MVATGSQPPPEVARTQGRILSLDRARFIYLPLSALSHATFSSSQISAQTKGVNNIAFSKIAAAKVMTKLAP